MYTQFQELWRARIQIPFLFAFWWVTIEIVLSIIEWTAFLLKRKSKTQSIAKSFQERNPWITRLRFYIKTEGLWLRLAKLALCSRYSNCISIHSNSDTQEHSSCRHPLLMWFSHTQFLMVISNPLGNLKDIPLSFYLKLLLLWDKAS